MQYAQSIDINGIIQYNNFVHLDSRYSFYWAWDDNGKVSGVRILRATSPVVHLRRSPYPHWKKGFFVPCCLVSELGDEEYGTDQRE